ncbi:hypothetical protein [Streptomyces clavuligerus]|uniref:hypothetical protein n=1 Tax=Streptomyces clavuligerus TaxID=1901 RepID=UPI00020D932F|nr:hypothetical protein [Streptomyces clavuligerus]WDN55984.1 hypothetical protein LL058_29300 [Streptomyces clavuligerus]
MVRTTVFAVLLKRDGLTAYESFRRAFHEAAVRAAEAERDPRLARVTVSRATFDRWSTGRLKGVPRREAATILRHLFGTPAEQLFDAVGDSADLLPAAYADGAHGTAAGVRGWVNPGLAPHWSGLLGVLAAADNTTGPRLVHTTVTGELVVIRDYRTRASGPVRSALLRVESRWAEFAGWTADNLDDGDGGPWLDHAFDLAREADDRPMEAYVLMRQAQRAAEHHRAQAAIDLATAALALDGTSDRDRALSAIRLAHGHALAGNTTACIGALEQARLLVERADATDTGDPTVIGHHCVPAYVNAYAAYCQLVLRRPDRAVAILQPLLTGWPTAYRQDGHLARAWLAQALLDHGEPAEAAVHAATVLTRTVHGGSARILKSLTDLEQRMPSGREAPGKVTHFRSALNLARDRMEP